MTYVIASARIEESKRRIGPVDVRVADAQAALDIALVLIDQKKGVIAFCNAHSVNLARRDPALVDALHAATVFNDGIGVDLASRLLYGTRFPANLNGTDFTPAVLAASPRPLRVFLLGSPPGVAERAAEALRLRFPQHQVVGTCDGFFRTNEEDAVVEAVAASTADLVLVGMGQPRQEIWATRHQRRLGAAVMCVGAFLDFAAGEVPRAPDWVRSIRLEWAFRLAQEPRRLARRYLIGNALFLAGILHERLRRGRLIKASS